MKTIIGKILVPHYIEYLVVADDLLILETSSGFQRYAESPNEVVIGKDIRIEFPELIGTEDILIDILEGRQKSLELPGIGRSIEPRCPLYIDLHITSFENVLIVLLENATKRMVLEQKLVQKNNEKDILLKSLYSYQNYLNQVITSMKDVLLVTTHLGYIITVNQSALDLFEYSREELIDQSISIITGDNIFLAPVQQLGFPSQTTSLQDNSVICQTKTGKT
ncbi:MAG: PAS domain-containing protein [Richelia sp. SM1_7_0]|nr:PAS domain-containing protein [Richelia sp. SM1_7_0]